MEKHFFVSIMASKRNGTLHIGMSSNLGQRVWQHKNKMVEGFTEKYNVKNPVYYEIHEKSESAMTRERQIKKWKRKLRLIEEHSPHWIDLYDKISS